MIWHGFCHCFNWLQPLENDDSIGLCLPVSRHMPLPVPLHDTQHTHSAASLFPDIVCSYITSTYTPKFPHFHPYLLHDLIMIACIPYATTDHKTCLAMPPYFLSTSFLKGQKCVFAQLGRFAQWGKLRRCTVQYVYCDNINIWSNRT